MSSLTAQDLIEIRAAVDFYVKHHVSINNPRYEEFSSILEKLTQEIIAQRKK